MCYPSGDRMTELDKLFPSANVLCGSTELLDKKGRNHIYHVSSLARCFRLFCLLRGLFISKIFGLSFLLCRRFCTSFSRTMKVFTQKFNPLSGKHEWVMQDENYDYQQEVARSSYADMLHDKERNKKYFDAIKKAVQSMKEQGRAVKVLDIGTGSGLLSMMAVHSGADIVTACEAFQPVAQCALKVIKDNGFEHRIRVIPKRSTEITVGVDGDMQDRANILVTEVFDTELIGEGALSTFRHALTHLLEPNSIVVPSAATVYAQVVQSPLISNFNKLHSIKVDESNIIMPPSKVTVCPGAAAVHDIQMAQLSADLFLPLTSPVIAFEFDFQGKKPLQLSGSSLKQVSALSDGCCEIVFMWWELNMDPIGDIILSCAPPWSHPEPHNMQWRDHWMQAVYYLPKPLGVVQGDMINLMSYHDEYSMWFTVSSPCNNFLKEICTSPICSCMMHCGNSRSRLGMLNDSTRNRKYIEILRKYVSSKSLCLCVSDGSLLPLIAAKLGARKVFAVEPQSLHYRVLKSFIEHNHEEFRVEIINKPFENITTDDLGNEKVDILIAEPYFTSSFLPWHTLYFWYLRDILSPLLSSSAIVVPGEVTLYGMAVEFDDLWKIRAPVIEAEGFDLSSFDQLVQEAISLSDAPVEPQPLWEYKCKAMTSPFNILTFEFSKDISDKPYERHGCVDFLSGGKCNGVALWVDFKTDNTVISTGPTKPVHPGKEVDWDMYTRQGVYFIQPFQSAIANKHILSYRVTFNANTGEFEFDFSVNSVS